MIGRNAAPGSRTDPNGGTGSRTVADTGASAPQAQHVPAKNASDPHILAQHFLALHVPGDPLLIPNPWDVGSAKLFASLGFRALATTSSGFAASQGRTDGDVPRAEVLDHCRALARATPLPVSADLENCFADAPEGVAETARLAAGTGIAGLSIEDFTGDPADPFYPADLAAERVRAVCEAVHGSPIGTNPSGTASPHLVVTARAENHIHGNPDLADTIARLQAFQAAGADVLYAPGLTDPADIDAVVRSVDLPVNVLARPGAPTVDRLAELGVARVSVGGSIAFSAYRAARDAAVGLLENGTFGYAATAGEGKAAMDAAARGPGLRRVGHSR